MAVEKRNTEKFNNLIYFLYDVAPAFAKVVEMGLKKTCYNVSDGLLLFSFYVQKNSD